MEFCWQLVPNERPSFDEIVARLSTLQSSTELQEQIHTIDTQLHSGDLEPLCSPSRSVLATYVNFPGSWSSQGDCTSAPTSVAASNPFNCASPLRDPHLAVLPSRDKGTSPSCPMPPAPLHDKSSEDEYDYVDRGKGKLFTVMSGKRAGEEEEKRGKEGAEDGYENSDLLPCSASLSKTPSGSLPDRDTSHYYNLPKGYLQAVESSRSKSSSNLPRMQVAEHCEASDDSESDLSSWLKTNGDHSTYLQVTRTTGATPSEAEEDCAKLSNDTAEHEAGPSTSMAEARQSKPVPPPKPVATTSC